MFPSRVIINFSYSKPNNTDSAMAPEGCYREVCVAKPSLPGLAHMQTGAAVRPRQNYNVMHTETTPGPEASTTPVTHREATNY